MPTIDSARGWYPAQDPVHGFDHILRVFHLAVRLAEAEGADPEIVGAAALLHDARAPETGPDEAGRRENHQHASASFARQILAAEGWPEDRIAAVEHCIRAHRFRDVSTQPETLEAQVLFDADKLDAIGAIGVARAVAYAAQNGQPAYLTPSEQFPESGQPLSGEGHSAYHEYIFKLRKLADRIHTPTAHRIAVQRHQFMTAFFEELAAEADPFES